MRTAQAAQRIVTYAAAATATAARTCSGLRTRVAVAVTAARTTPASFTIPQMDAKTKLLIAAIVFFVAVGLLLSAIVAFSGPPA